MNEPSCQEARRFMAMARETGDDAPVGIRFHLERCEVCSGLAARYRAGVSALARDTASPGAPLPAAAAVVAATRGARPRVRPWLLAAATALVAAVATLVAVGQGEPDPEPAPSPLAEAGAGATAPAPRSGPTPPKPAAAVVESFEGLRVTTADEPRALDDPAVATLEVAPGSEVAVPAWSPADAEVAVARGGVRVSLRPRVGDQRFAVRTEELVATAVGTAFSVTRSPETGTRVAVREGVVYVEVLGGGAVTLVAGDVLVVAPRERAPAPPERAALPPEEPPTAAARAPVASVAVAEPLAGRVQAARRLLARGRAEEAVAALRALSPTDDADRATVSALLGDAYALAGRLAAARDAYAEAARLGRGPVATGALADLAQVEKALGHAGAAEAAWRRLLALAPEGPLAPRALAALGDDEAVLARFPESREATAALLRLGRARLDARRWEAAATLFTAHLDARDPGRREAALVGLMRARLGQERVDRVTALLARYDRDFPDGARRAEVARIRAALGP